MISKIFLGEYMVECDVKNTSSVMNTDRTFIDWAYTAHVYTQDIHQASDRQAITLLPVL